MRKLNKGHSVDIAFIKKTGSKETSSVDIYNIIKENEQTELVSKRNLLKWQLLKFLTRHEIAKNTTDISSIYLETDIKPMFARLDVFANDDDSHKYIKNILINILLGKFKTDINIKFLGFNEMNTQTGDATRVQCLMKTIYNLEYIDLYNLLFGGSSIIHNRESGNKTNSENKTESENKEDAIYATELNNPNNCIIEMISFRFFINDGLLENIDKYCFKIYSSSDFILWGHCDLVNIFIPVTQFYLIKASDTTYILINTKQMLYYCDKLLIYTLYGERYNHTFRPDLPKYINNLPSFISFFYGQQLSSSDTSIIKGIISNYTLELEHCIMTLFYFVYNRIIYTNVDFNGVYQHIYKLINPATTSACHPQYIMLFPLTSLKQIELNVNSISLTHTCAYKQKNDPDMAIDRPSARAIEFLQLDTNNDITNYIVNSLISRMHGSGYKKSRSDYKKSRNDYDKLKMLKNILLNN